MVNEWLRKPHPVLKGTGLFALSRGADILTSAIAFNRGSTEINSAGGLLSSQNLYEHYGLLGLAGQAGLGILTVGLLALGAEKIQTALFNERETGRRIPVRLGFVIPTAGAILDIPTIIRTLQIINS